MTSTLPYPRPNHRSRSRHDLYSSGLPRPESATMDLLARKSFVLHFRDQKVYFHLSDLAKKRHEVQDRRRNNTQPRGLVRGDDSMDKL